MKTLKLTIGILAVMLFTVLHIQAQTINGKITDQNEEAVPFANVLLLNLPDSSLNKGITSDIEGKFQLPLKEEGSFLMKISVMGLEDFYRKISPEDVKNGVSLGTVKLQDKTEFLETVEVKAQRPQFISHPDKLVMDVENTSLHDGTTAMETLSKSPGVWVDQNGEISLNGKKGVRVLLDGRAVYVSGEELQSMLEGMPAESIKNIEIISNPSAKYDAEGAGGVININFKTDSKRGLNGSIFANHRYMGAHTMQGGINVNGKKNGFNYFVNANGGTDAKFRDMEAKRVIPSEDFVLTQTGEDRRQYVKPNLHAGFDYQISKNDNIGLIYRGSGSFFEGDWNTKNFVTEKNDSFKVNSVNDTENTKQNHTYGVNYTHDFSRNEAKLSVDVNYADLNSITSSKFRNEYLQEGNNKEEKLSNANTSYFDIYSAQADYEINVPAIETKFEAGAKFSLVNSKNNTDFFIHENSEKVYDISRSNNFRYSEQINAVYVNFTKNLSGKTTVKGGLRAEHTIVDGQALQSDQQVKRNFVSMFPSLFVQHKWTDNYETNFSYSRRITRARYSQLNPNVMYTDPYSYIKGNPDLRSQFTDGFSFSQIFAQQINLSVGYDLARDYIGEIPLQDEETNQTVFSIRNIDKMENLNLRLLVPIQITDFWQSNSQLILAHQRFNTVIEGQDQLNVQNMYSVRSTQSFSLPGDFKVDLLTSYQGPVAYGLYIIDAFWSANLGIKKSILNDKLDISLNFTDMFRSRRIDGTAIINKNRVDLGIYDYTQGIRFNLRYKFSLGDQFKARNKNIDLEEIRRAGGA